MTTAEAIKYGCKNKLEEVESMTYQVLEYSPVVFKPSNVVPVVIYTPAKADPIVTPKLKGPVFRIKWYDCKPDQTTMVKQGNGYKTFLTNELQSKSKQRIEKQLKRDGLKLMFTDDKGFNVYC